MSEAHEQATVFQWAAMMEHKYPALRLMFHIPNGGSRNAREGANLKRQGVRPGVPDICLPYPAGGFHALFIELKYGKNRVLPKQKEWLENLSKAGNATAVCYGAEEAINTITKYLEAEG